MMNKTKQLKVVTGGPLNGEKLKLPFGGSYQFTLTKSGKKWRGYYNAEGFWIDCGSLKIPEACQC